MNKTKLCNLKPGGILGGFSFIFVSLNDIKDSSHRTANKYFFCANVISVDDAGKFVSGALLTYSPHKTLEEAMQRWEELGPATVESEEGSDIEELAQKAIGQLQLNRWWVN